MGDQLPPLPVPDDHQAPNAWLPESSAYDTLQQQRQRQQHRSLPHPQQAQDESLDTAPPPEATLRPTPRVPIKAAVNTAFGQAPTTDSLDPDFVKRLTEHVTDQVIRNLQAVNIGGPTPPVPFHSLPSFSAQFTKSPSNRSPLRNSTDSFPPQFTPPSPHQERNDRDISPEPALSRDGSNYSKESKTSQISFASTRSNRETMLRAPEPEATPSLQRSKTTAADRPTPVATSSRKRPGGRIEMEDNEKVESSSSFSQPPEPHMRPASIVNDADEATTLEKIWQPLFVNGDSTLRLSQFLRGLAKHIIEDHEPRGSLIITPSKMLQFFDVTRTTKEHYPWSTIFGGQLCANSISAMYRKLLCQHHLIQSQEQEAPTIPGLTPRGFETFMTCLIQAHPDTEFERLAKAVKEMPISNADDHRERFPKELSRRLFPEPNIPAEQRILSSLAHESVLVPLERGLSAMPPPPPCAPPQQSFFSGRERNPYLRASQSSNAVEDNDLKPPYAPLERERKPYYAKEGTGKRYDTDSDRDTDKGREGDNDRIWQPARKPSRPTPTKYKSEQSEYLTPPPPWWNSGSPPQAMYKKKPTELTAIPPPNRKQTSTEPPDLVPPQNNYGIPKGSRRSPPPSRTFAPSAPTEMSNFPQSQYGPDPYSGQVRDRYSTEVDGDSSTLKDRRPSDRNMNYTIRDDPDDFPAPPRTVPTGWSGYAGNGITGNSPTGSVPRSAGVEDRRRNWYPVVGPGGTDGYGSGLYGSSTQG